MEHTTIPQSSYDTIDPQNPFENALENPAYRTDYRRILPQILLPHFTIPLFPEREERRAIRRRMNLAGVGVLLSAVGTQLLFIFAILLVLLCMDGNVSAYFNGDASGAMKTIQNSGIYMALHCLLFSGMNALVAIGGCRRMRQPIGGLFRTQSLSAWQMFQYICIGFGLQYFTALLYLLFKQAGVWLGISFPEATFDYFQSTRSILLVFLYTCILAPVTEELLYRGFLMKALSIVGTRFGIVVSAVLFGLMHGNVQQFLLGFCLGLFLGKIDARHNSLTPSIFVHISINTGSMLLSLAADKLSDSWGALGIFPLEFVVMAMSVMGMAFWFGKERHLPLPYPTQKQATRNRVFWSSPMLLLAILVLIAILLLNIFS